MYCEARTSTGLGCDSLGINQCLRCSLSEIIEDIETCYNTFYQQGKVKPNYPVPAIRETFSDNSGGVKDDYAIVGACFVDWSKGTIEVY